MKPKSQPTPLATKQEKLSDKVTGTYTPTKSVDVEIKKFYIAKEEFKDAPFTAMVHVVNFRKEKIIFAEVHISVKFLDENKKIIKTPTWYGWDSQSYMDLKPGENVVKVPFFPPPRDLKKLVTHDEPNLKGKNWKPGFRVTVAFGVAANIWGAKIGEDFKTVTYTDFLPEQYTLP
jgi:hypothetical protein